jgi:hypothetical protein
MEALMDLSVSPLFFLWLIAVAAFAARTAPVVAATRTTNGISEERLWRT